MTTRTELPGIRLPKPRPTVLEALTLVMAQRTLQSSALRSSGLT